MNTNQIIESGECQHITLSGTTIIWSTKDECLFCGTGKEWT